MYCTNASLCNILLVSKLLQKPPIIRLGKRLNIYYILSEGVNCYFNKYKIYRKISDIERREYSNNYKYPLKNVNINVGDSL